MSMQEYGILDKLEHGPILRDIDNIAAKAGVQVRYIKNSMSDVCSPKIISWVKSYRSLLEKGNLGLVLEGVSKPDSICQSIAGALLRNYIDAKVVPLNQLLDRYEEGTMPNPTVLLIPNLYVKIGADKGIAPWRMQQVYDILLERASQSKSTVVYVQSKSEMKDQYGSLILDFLEDYTWINKE